MFREGGEPQFGQNKDSLTPEKGTLSVYGEVRVGHGPADASADDHCQMYPFAPSPPSPAPALGMAWHGTARHTHPPTPSFHSGRFLKPKGLREH